MFTLIPYFVQIMLYHLLKRLLKCFRLAISCLLHIPGTFLIENVYPHPPGLSSLPTTPHQHIYAHIHNTHKFSRRIYTPIGEFHRRWLWDLEIRPFQKGAGIFVLRLGARLQPTSAPPKNEIFKDAVGSRLGST